MEDNVGILVLVPDCINAVTGWKRVAVLGILVFALDSTDLPLTVFKQVRFCRVKSGHFKKAKQLC